MNSPDPVDPSKATWLRRDYPIAKLVEHLNHPDYSSGAGRLPLARRLSIKEQHFVICWHYDGSEWKALSDAEEAANSACDRYTNPFDEKTMTEWEVKDINGDGYPDVVFNSSPILWEWQTVYDERESQTSGYATSIQVQTLVTRAGVNNHLKAVFHALGVHIADGAQPFSAPVTLRANDPCGVAQSVGDQSVQNLQCSIQDINGDGIADRVNGPSVRLGTGSLGSGAFFTASPLLTLPGWLEAQQNNAWSSCVSESPETTTFLSAQTIGLRDLTGDGIPDYIATFGPDTWNVFIGTGTGFAAAIPINRGIFALSSSVANCAGTASTTTEGVYDVDGDGRADLVRAGHVSVLVGPDGIPGDPSAGRLVQIDNGFGASTQISYRSVKADGGLHQVPFAEVVVDSVQTTGTQGFGGTLVATRYAYTGAELVYSPALDAFRFPGYRRQLVMQTPVAQPAGVATILITDSYAAISAVDPYGIAGGASADATQRYRLYQRVGRTRDVTVLSGHFGVEAVPAHPRLLLGIDVDRDDRRIAGAHYEWDARLLASSSDPAGPEPCTEMVFPYDEAGSAAFAASHASYDACTGHGFRFASSVQAWRGDAAPPSAANVETRTEVRAIDHLGRVLTAAQLNDVHRSDDDLCVVTEYAAPTGTNEQQRHAPSSRKVTNCGSSLAEITYAGGRWEYDHLAVGSVSSGFPTAYTVERRNDAGGLLGTIRQFDAHFDALGNPTSVTTTREDGATRTATAEFDPFGLVPLTITTTATGVPTMQTTITSDPVTLNVLSVTDPNGTQSGATFDGFDRVVHVTVTPADGATAAMSFTRYLGFSGDDSRGRRIEQKVFTDPVSLSTASTAPGRIATVYLDELGRQRRTEMGLGADYDNQIVVAGHRTYDGLGRVVFAADPYPSTQSFATAYGTTAFFNADGSPHCVVRANGQRSTLTTSTDENLELYPTCIQRRYQDHTEVVSVQDAASLLAGSPQAGVAKTSYATAIGRVLERSTWKGAARLEHAAFSYDRLGHRTSMTRYQNADGATLPVTSSWRYDSLGQVLDLNEPDSVPQVSTYSNWGELVAVVRYVTSPPGGSDGGPVEGGPPSPDSDPVPSELRVAMTYDALGRLVHSEERTSGVTDPETVKDYFYDRGLEVATQVRPTHVLGRLALATSPTGSESFSYDGLGRVNARVFTDNLGEAYVEKQTLHADGSLRDLDLLLPDTAYANENVHYQYDSAGRADSVEYTAATNHILLYQASSIDPLGRVRQATYGQANYTASYADVGRRLLQQVTVASVAGSRVFSYQSYDPVGRERQRNEIQNGAPGTPPPPNGDSGGPPPQDGGLGTTSSFTYDALGRLSTAAQTRELVGNTIASTHQYTYDALGNLLGLSSIGTAPGLASVSLSYLDTDRDRICRIKYGSDSGTACNVTYDEVGSIVTQATATGQRRSAT